MARAICGCNKRRGVRVWDVLMMMKRSASNWDVPLSLSGVCLMDVTRTN